MNNRKICIIPIILFLLIITHESWGQQNQEAKIITDVAYGDDVMQKMDVYLVENRTVKTPLLILVHGGGWMSGDKVDFNYFKDLLYSAGINVINVNYRLASNENKIHYQEIMKDLSKALAKIEDKAEEWDIRTQEWIMWGNSAGGHLSLLYAYNYDEDKRLSAVVSFAGPVKLDNDPTFQKAKPEDIRGLLPLIAGAPFEEMATNTAYQLASPFYGQRFISTLLIHGEKDDIVPIAQSELMYKHLQKNKIRTDFVTLFNGDHGGTGATEASQQLFRQKAFEWIKEYSK